MKKIIIPSVIVLMLMVMGCSNVDDATDPEVEEVVAVLDCDEGMNEYQVAETPIQFCYDPAWGEVVVEQVGGVEEEVVAADDVVVEEEAADADDVAVEEEEVVDADDVAVEEEEVVDADDVAVEEEAADGPAGKKYSVSFSVNLEAPTLYYETTDYVMADEGVVCVDFIDYSRINLYGPDEQVAERITELCGLAETDLKVRKGEVAGARAARVHFEYGTVDAITYFVPDAFEGYNMMITAPFEYAVEIDDFLFDMIL